MIPGKKINENKKENKNDNKHNYNARKSKLAGLVKGAICSSMIIGMAASPFGKYKNRDTINVKNEFKFLPISEDYHLLRSKNEVTQIIRYDLTNQRFLFYIDNDNSDDAIDKFYIWHLDQNSPATIKDHPSADKIRKLKRDIIEGNVYSRDSPYNYPGTKEFLKRWSGTTDDLAKEHTGMKLTIRDPDDGKTPRATLFADKNKNSMYIRELYKFIVPGVKQGAIEFPVSIQNTDDTTLNQIIDNTDNAMRDLKYRRNTSEKTEAKYKGS